MASPVSTGSPMASPSSQSGESTGLAAAFSNLQDQQSYIMTAKLSNLQGSFAKIPGIGEQSTVKIERSGKDQHLTIMSNDGHTTFEVWQIGDQVWANIGSGPVKVSKDNTVVAQFVSMLSADQQIIESFESTDATYTSAGTDTVNGIQTNVETATYTMARSKNNMFFSGDENGTVTSKIWVAQDGNYLVQGEFTINGSGSASSPAGSAMMGTPMSASPSAGGSAEVTVNVTQIGQVQSIQPPS
jgi:hypothetical protein